ncbi:hypothetical protein [Thalassotalea piscium]|uniref:DUF4178 domain-containing protein n=1 Tax=Thalassotalea piscium TaxID=1230533 RepID=A0A7X0TT99_9GAMM|nr:hypothetical protein [Thalassotalea piscium]MBB6543017.1 hypothetical protein [Thalassotalea piscium]
MSFLKNIFKKEQPQRKISQANDLMVNDIIALTDSFALPESLRSAQFQVTAVNTYEFENKTQTEWVLSGNNNIELYLSLDVDDKTYLKFSVKIDHQDVETLFNLDDFATIFDEPGNAILQRQNDNSQTSGWTAEQYQQRIYAQVGYFHRKDDRHETLSKYEGEDSGEQFELYQLLDQDEYCGIELEVWQDGDTDVFLTMYRPTTDIVDMYPGS